MSDIQASKNLHKDILAVAADYLRTHCDQDVSMSETAAAAGVGTRTLQIAFRESLDITPTEWLLKLRLRRARLALLAAEPGTSVTSAAFGSGLHHLGRFSHRYNEEFSELPSDTLRTAQKLKTDKKRRVPQAIPDTLRRNSSESHRLDPSLQDEKPVASIRASQILSHCDDIVAAWDQIHMILSGSLRYKRGALILKRTLDGRPLVFSHCRADMNDERFKLDMKRVNSILTSASGIVHSVLKSGQPRIENDLELALDYAALDASVLSEICVPVTSRGEVIAAINFESERKNAFDLHDLALASSLSASSAEQLRTARSDGDLGLSEAV